MVNSDGECSAVTVSLGGSVAPADWFSPRVGGHPALILHSSNELAELSQWQSHNDSSAMNIVLAIKLLLLLIIILSTSNCNMHSVGVFVLLQHALGQQSAWYTTTGLSCRHDVALTNVLSVKLLYTLYPYFGGSR